MHATTFHYEGDTPFLARCGGLTSGFWLTIENGRDELTIHAETVEQLFDLSDRIAEACRSVVPKTADDIIGAELVAEAAKVADPNYTPSLGEAMRHPAEFVAGMTETRQTHHCLPNDVLQHVRGSREDVTPEDNP